MVRFDPNELARELAACEARHAHRQRRCVQGFPDAADATLVQVDGQRLRNFCSNDYLGLARHPALVQAATACMAGFGFGAGAAHLVTGHSSEHQQLEEELAAFTGRERALLFSTGYMANLGVVSALAGPRDWLLADRISHASLIDAARLSGARLKRYPHADASAAEHALGAAETPAALLITDGVFSMDGDVAPLRELAHAARRHGSALLVDDAHGCGVIGPGGAGAVAAAGLDAQAVPLLVGTLGKAFGSFGAFVASDAALIELLIQRARTYRYTTALPPPVAAAARAALRLSHSEPWRRLRVLELVARFRSAAATLGLPLTASSTPIQPLIVGESAAALQLSAALMQRGFWVTAIRPPTVPAGSARLRITFSAAHQESQVDALLQALAELWPQRAVA